MKLFRDNYENFSWRGIFWKDTTLRDFWFSEWVSFYLLNKPWKFCSFARGEEDARKFLRLVKVNFSFCLTTKRNYTNQTVNCVTPSCFKFFFQLLIFFNPANNNLDLTKSHNTSIMIWTENFRGTRNKFFR